MADIRRPSGRQTAQSPAAPKISGKAPASTSGRQAPAPVAPPSARMPAAPPSARMPAPAPSGRAPVASPSGRAPVSRPSAPSLSPAEIAPRVSSQRIAPAPAPARAAAAARGAGQSQRGGSAPKKKMRGGPELIIAAGIIGVLAVGAIVMYTVRQKEKKDVNSQIEKLEETQKNNFKRGADAAQKAFEIGLNYVQGKEEFDPAKHTAPFAGDDNIYNVIYERSTKEKRNTGNKNEVKSLNDRLRLQPMSSPAKDEGKRKLTYGFGDAAKTVPVVISTEMIPAPEGDQVNLGGKITVVVKAENDIKFDKAREYKAPEEKKPAAPAEKK